MKSSTELSTERPRTEAAPRRREPVVDDCAPRIGRARAAQARWAEIPVPERLAVLRRLRRTLAAAPAEAVALASPDHPRRADALAAEVLPFLDALRFLERHAAGVLAPRRPIGGRAPGWMGRLTVREHRDPLGLVLVIAPSNYPLFLAGVQCAQALAAGNAVLLKPAPGREEAADLLKEKLVGAGLPEDLLALLPSDPEIVPSALAVGVDHVLVTGSATTGRRVLELCARRGVPATPELSGADAMFVLEDADLPTVARALAFTLRLNAGRTCIAPRRVFVEGDRGDALLALLAPHLPPPLECRGPEVERFQVFAREALHAGARLVHGELPARAPFVFVDVPRDQPLLEQDLFLPWSALVPVRRVEDALADVDEAPFGLGLSIFGGGGGRAEALARSAGVGFVSRDDVVAPSADPRVSFGGRRASGYGVTRGAEGLRALTAPKIVSRRGRGPLRHLETPHATDEILLSGLATLLHAAGTSTRFRGLKTLVRAIRDRARTPKDAPLP